MTTADRRTSERIDVSPGINLIEAPYRLLNVGTGGFALESPVPFVPDEPRMFQFTLSDGALVGLRAAAAHVMRVNRPGEPASYVVGFALVDADDSDVVRLIGTVAERVAAVVAA